MKFAFTAALRSVDGRFGATRCNCTFCTKLSTTNLHLPGLEQDFTLQSPSSKDQVATYARGERFVERYFCSTCGAHCWMQGAYPHEGKMIPIFAVNLATVDQPQEGFDLSQVRMQYFNMLQNDFASGLGDVPYPGGLL